MIWFVPLLGFLSLAEAYVSIDLSFNYNITCSDSPYRSIDGSCNNLNNPLWGTPGTTYARLFNNNSYVDGINEYYRKNLQGPRDISLQTFPDIIKRDKIWTSITVAFGQTVVHDMALAASKPAICSCIDKRITSVPDTSKRCRPIILPKWDPYHIPEGENCFDFVRTVSTIWDNKKLPAQQINEQTAFLDGSHIYGTSDEQAKSLRTFKNGLLAYQVRNGDVYPPQSETPCDPKSPYGLCLEAGDPRVNQNPALALIQTAELRAHNYYAKQLCVKINPQWTDEKCYQEARRIMIAFIQNIVWKEYMPIILGDDYWARIKSVGGVDYDYNNLVNPAVLNEHATAAFRVFHSTIPGFIRRFTDDRTIEGDIIRLSDHFGNPDILVQGNSFTQIGISLLTDPQNAVDRYYDSEVTQFLFRDGLTGEDLPAIDTNRGRDHGIASYKTAREGCGLGPVKSFADLEKYIRKEYVELLMRIYKKVEDVELYVAGVLENLIPGTLLGPTFHCIISKQFLITKVADRYFYTNDGTVQPYPFTPEQLESIREGATISSLMCNNVDGINQVQKRGFELISDDNPLVDCDDLPTVNLALWKEVGVSGG